MKSPREIGKVLKEAREKKGITLERIWNATRIQGRIVEALEEGTAENSLARVYVILFLKKYASFLGLDTQSLLGDYKAFHSTPEEPVLDIKREPEPAELPKIKVDIRKYARPAVFLISAALLIFFVLFLGMKLLSFYRSRKGAAHILQEVRETGIDKKAQRIFPIPKGKAVDLELQGTNDVWMKVWKDGKPSFEGTVGKDKKKEFSFNNHIRLWVGRAEELNFTINDVPLGKIGKGNIKNIQITRNGLKVGRKWLLGAE